MSVSRFVINLHKFTLYKVFFFFILGGSHFLPVLLQGQNLLQTNGRAIVNQLGDTLLLRGMGLGGWMLQEGYMLQTADFANPQHKIRAAIEELIGPEDTDLFYETWLANHVRKADIDSLKSWGFNSVRLPLHYNLFTLPIEEEPVSGQQTWLSKGFELTDSLISWCRQQEMYVILDLHAAPGGQGYDAGISDFDDTKPSLWESKANRDKTVALWKKLAERYADEQWVAGYDLLNEPNWNLPGNVALRNLYQEITDSIRSVDDSHMIIIEGNWFANDFTGLTPPWDPNLVYSPHKYWSTNDTASMQWVLDIRNAHNVPLYLGESGENSNAWFRDAIKLFEDLQIGWAWWPLKKIESITCPLSVPKSDGYQLLLDYWNGNAPKPSALYAKLTLLDLADGLKIEKCTFQKDVIDAMFRQVTTDETLPFNGLPHDIPGIIHATGYDLGRPGLAYYDTDIATYHISTGNYTAWNRGWTHRNDGVDIEPCIDDVNSNGLNVGFLDAGEWMNYQVNVLQEGVYNVNVRVASEESSGQFHFSANGTDLSQSRAVGNTGGWQSWKTITVPNIILDESDAHIRFHIDQSGFNVSSFEFSPTGLTSEEVPTTFISAHTVDALTISVHLNKPIEFPLPGTPAGLSVLVNGQSVPISSIEPAPNNPRQLILTIGQQLKGSDLIRISYESGGIQATDGTFLSSFFLQKVRNTLTIIHQIPGRIEAEAFSNQSGIELETTTDLGGGQNVAYLDPGDWMDYEVDITEGGLYRIEFRTASLSEQGGLQMQFRDESGSVVLQPSVTFPSTGGWQSWSTTPTQVTLPQGRHNLRLLITQAPFNLNWIDWTLLTTDLKNPAETPEFAQVFPNPTEGRFSVQLNAYQSPKAMIRIVNAQGFVVLEKTVTGDSSNPLPFSLNTFPDGLYLVVISLEDGRESTHRILKVSH